jgi:hypothetical protein
MPTAQSVLVQAACINYICSGGRAIHRLPASRKAIRPVAHLKDMLMRAEPLALVDDIKQAVALLRRHL